MSNQTTLKEFSPKASHTYLIDTNILMYLFSPIASYGVKKQEQVSKFMESSKILNAGLVTTSLVLGEFFHVNLKIYYENWCKTQKEQIEFNFKKDYRPTSDFNESVTAINRSIDLILKMTDRFPDNFSSINLHNVANNCCHAEFTDSYLLELSNQNGWIIVSNDGDLLNHPNRKQLIITSN